jgi:PadR family transcriptional regulator PadR
MRQTSALVQVALALMDDPFAEHWGYDLTCRADVRSGVVYPMLSRMLEENWVEDGWEDPASTGGRPARRYYVLTDLGRRELGALLTAAADSPRFAGLFT